ncbi:tyrosine-type recombinase/integrase [Quadrisphaera sp. INWT6]|uniref:tyrosine-type recombinase/integrase n=1 Tax=Quadrisphaera sp. INWT6 TaxID=2596917 RepID=UPI0018922DEE|nr:tyrosine-type recombinase/integrase [Quadrisphaera sp. INWT6]
MVEHLSGPAAVPSGMTLSRAWQEYVATATVDPKTLSLYETVFACHVEPVLGDRRVADLTADDVEALLGGARSRGSSPSVVRLALLVVAVTCRRAMALGVVDRLPTQGVRAPRPVAPRPRVLTPQEFTAVRDAMPTPAARLLAELLVRSGLRVGEALALVVGDLHDGALVVSRCLSEPGRRFSGSGQRFVLRPSTKNGADRRVVIGEDFARRLEVWAQEQGLGPADLLFPGRLVLPEPSGRSSPTRKYSEPLTAERLQALGTFTGPNGTVYQHGTVNGYATGRCREACCRQAVAEYSAARARARRALAGPSRPARRSGLSAPAGAQEPLAEPGAPLGATTPQGWARVWSEAVRAAGLDFRPLPRQTRHAHASWLNGGGVSVDEIAERLGHRDERSTRGYVRPVGAEPEAVSVLDALLEAPASPARGAGSDNL